MAKDFSAADALKVEEVVTKRRDVVLHRELQINAQNKFIFLRSDKGRMDGDEFVDETQVLARLVDEPAREETFEKEATPARPRYTQMMGSTDFAEWVRAEAKAPTFEQCVRQMASGVGKIEGWTD